MPDEFTSQDSSELLRIREERRRYKDTAKIFNKINEKLDPNSRLKVSRYCKGSQGEFNRVMDYPHFKQMMKSCRLDFQLSEKELNTVFDYLSVGGKVEFSEFRKALDQEWVAQTNNTSVSIPKSNDLKQYLIHTARKTMFGQHESDDAVIRKLYRNIVGDFRKEISVRDFARNVSEKFGLNTQDAGDLTLACDKDCDGFVSIVDFTNSMLESEKVESNFMISSRHRSLDRLKQRLNRVQENIISSSSKNITSSLSSRNLLDDEESTKKLYEKAVTALNSRPKPLNSERRMRPENDGYNDLHHRPINWMPEKVQQTSPTTRARKYFTENGYNASTMRIASKVRQQERYEAGLREIREQEERKRIKAEIGRVASSTKAKYEFEMRAQERQEGTLRRAELNGKKQLPATRLRCFEGNIPFLNPNLERMQMKHHGM